MIQGGDPKGDGTGGPGYKFNDEPITRDYERGILAMANSGSNTNGSQFFIMHKNYPLPKNYVIFGKIANGFDVLDKIAETPVAANRFGELSSPTKNIIIKSVEIIEKWASNNFIPLENTLWLATRLSNITNTGFNTPCEFSNGIYLK